MWQFKALLRALLNYNSTLLLTVNQDIQAYLFTQTMPEAIASKLFVIMTESILYCPAY